MSELIYTSRSHSKTLTMMNSLLHDIEFYKREGLKEIHLAINKGSMQSYHLSYILETLEKAGCQTEISEGINTINLYVE
jgi:hypothetical protein